MSVSEFVTKKHKASTARLYIHLLRKYKSWVEKTGKLDPVEYLRFLEESGASLSTLRNSYYAISDLYEYQGKKLRDILRAPSGEEELHQPTLTPEEIRQMVEWAKDKGSEEERAYLALATVYGMRRIELAQFSQKDIGGRYIKIRTAKRGTIKEHFLPDEIADHVLGHLFKPRSLTYMSYLFKAIATKSGVRNEKGMGWHSIRRALVTGLLRNKAEPVFVAKFLRWAGDRRDSQMRMLLTYAQFSPEEIDEAIYKVHPFLRYWR